ncbi:uncharacterized protein F4812DRAFT_467538 [Daldinia caldariorum]|uniref:uncharacterized protein n=1 Tax=Daldinia caldariorum TaxID=326644 RepID=UPI0020072473|nr:uncharacterized protein F4812DRAFT_467538 [Daldinia caldariorum]KAI1471478.1 hypothetical protein F4812DRAFT_467538 [Daldinia caldariorum]
MAVEKDSLEITQLPPVAGPELNNLHDVQATKGQSTPESDNSIILGRQVLLRHQQVLLAPITPIPTPTIVAIAQSNEKTQVNGRSPVGGKMSMKMERMRDVLTDLKRRVTPQQYPHAWLLFLAIITIAAGAIIAGWCGLAFETMHRVELMGTSSAATTSTGPPAQRNVEVSGGFDVAEDGLLGLDSAALGTGTAMGDMTPSGANGRDAVSGHLIDLTSTDGLTAETVVARDLVTTIYVTVTAPPETTSSASTSFSSESKGTSANAIPTHGTTSMISMTTAPKSTPSVNTASTSTVEPQIYCPHSERPLIWTPCVDHPTSAASHGVANPFTIARRALVTLWKAVAG